MIEYKKKLLNLMLYGYGGLMILLIGMSTGARLLNSDILYQDGFWVIVLDIVIALADAFAFALSAAVVIYGIYLAGYRAMKTVYAAFIAVTTFHYVAVLCIGWLIYPGTMPETVEEWLLMIFESLFLYILIDCLRLLVVGIVASKAIAKQEAIRCDSNRKAKILGDEQQDQRSLAFPFVKFISFKNPIQISVAAMAAVYWIVFLVQYVYYAFMNLIKLNFLDYVGFQILELGFYALMACICYCVAVFILIRLDEKMPKAQ